MSEQSFFNANKGSETFNGSVAASFVSQKRFYDDANFPKGFKRSGDFTNKEAELLELHGHAMKNLAEGKRCLAPLMKPNLWKSPKEISPPVAC